jgi:hypothetical protein
METPLRKPFAQLAQLTSVSALLPQNETKLLHLHSYETTVFHKLYNTHHEAKVNL